MHLSNVPIGKKLILAFAVVLLAIGAMGATLFVNFQALRKSDVQRTAGNQMVRDTSAAEFAMARQENSFRGYLVSDDPYYIERINTHRATFKAKLESLRGIGTADADAHIDEAEKAADAWYDNVVVKGIALARNPATRAQAEAMVSHDGEADRSMAPVEGALDDLAKINAATLQNAKDLQGKATTVAEWSLYIGLGLTILIALAASWVLSRGIANPVLKMVGYMRKLQGGDNAVEIPEARRKDEFGQMAIAILAFRDAAIDKIRIEKEALANRSQSEVERANSEAEKARKAEEDAVAIGALAQGLAAVANGDLTHRMTAQVAPQAEQLKADFNSAVAQLQDAMTVVVTNVAAIRSGSGEISQAADDLSRRTEQQAASLEETAAALDEITATVNRTASGARQASDTVQARQGRRRDLGQCGPRRRRGHGRDREVGPGDQPDHRRDRRDRLPDQSAGPERRRRGGARRRRRPRLRGRASEVRALAQRSAEAAKEIKVLISASTTQVNTGVSLVGQTGEALQRIVGRVAEIDGLVSEIAASAQEQATGLQQVNTAVNQMDQVTQQNAAMVEESTAASHSLSQEAESLASSVSRFRIGAGRPVAPPPAPNRGATAQRRPSARSRPCAPSAAAAPP
jgi:methyl-accepting chemotaxis protein